MTLPRRLLPGVLFIFLTAQALAQTGSLTIHVDHPGAHISPMLYGLMTEEINHSYDGGLYAELIQNRIFKNNAKRPVHWSLIQSPGAAGEIAIDPSEPVNDTALPTSLQLAINSVPAGGRVGIANSGFWGIPVWPDTTYHASFYAKASAAHFGPLTVDIESDNGGAIYTSASIAQITGTWKRYQVTLTTGKVAPSQNNRFVISAAAPGTVWLNLVSLFPPTFNDQPNGNRIDLMQKLADMHAAFLRLPGGNYLEGNKIDQRFEWKKTIGPLDERPGHQGPWGYRSSDGLGLLEYLKWCEDLHIEPVLAVYAGYSLQQQHVDPGPALQPFVDDALDEIEYVTGDQATRWGHQRALDGHLEPFKLTYIEIGNEDWFDHSHTYDGRFAQFFDAIKAKYPQLQLIATMPVKGRTPDVLDDHYYRSAADMAHDWRHYDKYDRNGTKIFVGEWASIEGKPTPNFKAALGDAAWLIGLERNSDVVVMSAYAPLLVNVSNRRASQWGTNLIGYNAIASFGSPSYYMQSLFSKYRGDTILPVDISGSSEFYATASRVDDSGQVIIKAVNFDPQPRKMEIHLSGIKQVVGHGSADVLTGQLPDQNTLAEPTKIAPKQIDIPDASPDFVHEFPADSISVIRLNVR